MSTPPVMSGAIPAEGPHAVLLAIERRATSGVLRFEAPGVPAESIRLVRGAADPDDEAARAALERFLLLTRGTYEVHQRLPALPVSRGDEEAREGRLGVHGVNDLLQYCEAAGLTGALFVTSDERYADFLYDAGELVAVRVFGDGGEDVHHALAWEDGGFRIEAWNEMPALPMPSGEQPLDPIDVGGPAADAESEKLLKVVEVTLSSLLDDRAPPPPEAAPAPADESAPPRRSATKPPRTDATVRVIYLGPPGAARRTKTPPPIPRPARPAADREKTEPNAVRSDPTIETHAAPVTQGPREPTAARPRTQSFFGEAGLVATATLALSAALFLAAIAYPFVLE